MTSEEKLAQVFSTNFPSPNFDRLLISGNNHLKIIKAGVFGNATFKNLSVVYGILEEVEVGALSGSYLTSPSMSFFTNHIANFPFEGVDHFVQLEDLSLGYNNLIHFPHIASASLVNFDLQMTPFSDVILPATAFRLMPALESIDLVAADIQDIASGIAPGISALMFSDMFLSLASIYEAVMFYS